MEPKGRRENHTMFNSVIQREFEPIIPQWMFEERKAVYFQIPFCPKNEKVIRAIINKLEAFTNDPVKFVYYWKTPPETPSGVRSYVTMTSPYQQSKILEAYYIRKFKPTLNDQLDIRFIQLFRNGIT